VSKPKNSDGRKTMIVRVPRQLYDKLLRASASRSVKEGHPVSMNAIMLEAVEKVLNN